MKSPSVVIKTFTDRYPLIGPTIWILCVQYFVIQFIAANAWSPPYSFLKNPISDLGNTACGIFSERFVCSPLHSLMNASFIMLGITMAVGALLIYQEFKESTLSFVGFSFMSLAGIGTLMVGLFPENTYVNLHLAGAFLPFFVGNIGLIVLGIGLRIPSMFKGYTFLSGIVSLLAVLFLVTNHYLGLGVGGMERFANYPQIIWLIIFGLYISRNHIIKRLSSANTT